MNDAVDETFVHNVAVGVLEEWLDGTYATLPGGEQRVVKLWSDGCYVLRDMTGIWSERKFRVSVVVEEVK